MVLPQDLILEIISLLPLKSGIRCKCLNKTFNKLIPNPKFLRRHGFLHSNKKIFFQFSDQDYECYDMISLNPTFMKNIKDINVFPVMSSPNSGRLLLHFFYGDYCVFNPVTGAYAIIRYPAPQPSGSTFPVGLEGLVDDVSSPHYKLVAILERPRIGILDGGLLRVCIFESDRNSWREKAYEMVDVPPVRGCITSYRDWTRPVLVNGRLYWLVYVLSYTLVLVFDVNNEIPFIIEGPDLPDGCCTELGNGPGGSVAIVAAYDEGKSGKFGIYVLDDVEKKWQAQRTIEGSIPGPRMPVYFDEEIFISLVWGGVYMRTN